MEVKSETIKTNYYKVPVKEFMEKLGIEGDPKKLRVDSYSDLREMKQIEIECGVK